MDKHVVKAEEFVLVDDKGQTLAVLAGGCKGGAVLCFFDQSGTRRCLVGVDDEGTPIITLGDEHEHTTVSLAQADGSAGLKVMDTEGDVRVQVGVDGLSNQAFVTLGNSGDSNQLRLFANEDGSTSVILHGSDGIPTFGLRVHPNGEPAFLVQHLGDILGTLHKASVPTDNQATVSEEPTPKSQSRQNVGALDGRAKWADLAIETSSTPHPGLQTEPDAWSKTGMVVDE